MMRVLCDVYMYIENILPNVKLLKNNLILDKYFRSVSSGVALDHPKTIPYY